MLIQHLSSGAGRHLLPVPLPPPVLCASRPRRPAPRTPLRRPPLAMASRSQRLTRWDLDPEPLHIKTQNSGAVATASLKGFAVGTDLLAGDGRVTTEVGGRADVRKTINDVHLTLSLTDATVREFEAAPWLTGALVTAEKKLNSHSTALVGFDAGAQGGFAKIAAETDVSGKSAGGSAIWFSRGNHVRAEGTVRLESRAALWGTHTFNDAAHLSNSTWVNLRQREGFVIKPFTVPISTSAAKLVFERDGYVVEPAYDFRKRESYLSVGKTHYNNHYKASYAVREEIGMLEAGWSPNGSDNENAPFVRGYIKTHVGRRHGLGGTLSIGVIVEQDLDI